ncbi:group 1 glycosyl transferase [Haloferax sp. BAB-2207]|nr:group 1 glycosyl transferase [Haloferax sp. BAB-2207]
MSVIAAERNIDKQYFDKRIDLQQVGIRSNTETLLKSANPLTYYRLLEKIRKVDPEIIHITQGFFWLNPVLPFLSEYPIVYTDHEPEETNDVTFYDRTPIFSYSKKHFRSVADVTIVHGEYLKRILLERGIPKHKIKVLKHGVYQHYREVDKAEEVTDSNDQNILFFGLVADYKGIDVLDDAIPDIMSMCPDATVTIAGKGDVSQYLSPETIESNHVNIYNEFIPDEDVGKFFRNADVVVLPYKRGSQSGVLTISYEYRTPVVVTNVGSLPEAVDDEETGHIVPPNDSVALSEAIVDIITSERTKEHMSKKIDKKVKNELSWDEICIDLVNTYRSVLAQ